MVMAIQTVSIEVHKCTSDLENVIFIEEFYSTPKTRMWCQVNLTIRSFLGVT